MANGKPQSYGRLSEDQLFKHEGYRSMPTDQIVGVHGTGAELEIVPDEPGFMSTTKIAEWIHERMRLIP